MTLDPRSQRAFENHLKRLESRGCTDLGGEWEGAHAARALKCPEGHVVKTRPSHIQQGNGSCRICAQKDPETAYLSYIRRIEALGCEDLDEKWEGSGAPRKLLCSQGHIVKTRPNSVQQGHGPCRICAGKTWDVFYLVTNPDTGDVKFGITSGDPKGRLANHAKVGYTWPRMVLVDLDEGTARKIESACEKALKRAGIPPLHGKEWFPSDALSVVQTVIRRYRRSKNSQIQDSKDYQVSNDPFASGTSEVDAFLSGGSGAPAQKFPKIGYKVRGLVVDKQLVQERDYDEPDKLIFWRDSKRIALTADEVKPSDKPSMQVVLTLLTEENGTWDRAGNPVAIEDDDGQRRLFVKSHLLKAVKDAVRNAGAPTVEILSILEVTHSALGKQSNPRYSQPKMFVAALTAPGKVKDDDPLMVKYKASQADADAEDDGDPFA